MRKISVLLVLLFVSCSFFENENQSLIDKDKAELKESLHTYNVLLYKYFKIESKAKHITDTSFAYLKPEKEKLEKVSTAFGKYDKDPSSLSPLDYIRIYKDFKDIKSYIEEVDEDIFPSYKEIENPENLDYTKQEIAELKTAEHAIFAAFSILTRNFGRDIVFYEVTKMNAEALEESEGKTLLRLFKSFLYLEKGLFYLSEDELTKNINWITKQNNTNYKKVLSHYGEALGEEKSKKTVLSTNYLLRGIDRLLMGVDASEKKALKDFQAFIDITKELGVVNEITLSIETYLHLKSDTPEKAIVTLLMLKESRMLSSKEKASIDEAILYLKDRESDKVLNTVYDKYFLGKIISIYAWNTIKETDWKKIMKENDIEFSDELFANIETVQEFINNIDKYTSTESLDKAGEKLKETTKGLWNKAKEMVE